MRRSSTTLGRCVGLALLVLMAGPTLAKELPGSVGEFDVRSWTRKDGLPQASVTALARTSDGYLWAGTFGGLVRFNGIGFEIFDVERTGGRVGNRIAALLEDDAGDLWIGSDRLTRYREGVFHDFPLPVGSSVQSIAQDPKGRIWLATDAGLMRVRGHELERIEIPGLPAGSAVTELMVDSRGRLWCGFGNALGVYMDGEFARAGPLAGSVTALAESPTGTVFVGTYSGDVFEVQGLRAVRVDGHARRGSVLALAFDDRGRLWIGGGSFSVGTPVAGAGAALAWEDLGLDAGNLRAFLQDVEGNIWLGTDLAGLLRLRESPLIRPASDDLSSVHAMDISPQALPLIRMDDRLYEIDPPNLVEYAALPGESLSHRTRDGAVWGTSAQGIVRVDPETAARTWFPDSADLTIRTFFEDSQGALWLGGTDLKRYSDGAWATWNPGPHVGGTIYVIAPRGAGGLWLGIDSKLVAFIDGRFAEVYTHDDGLALGDVRALLEDDDGALWIGSYGGGISRFKDGVFRRFTTDDGLPDNSISSIVEDAAGFLWINSNVGAFRVRRQALIDHAAGRLDRLDIRRFDTGEANGGFSPSGGIDADGVLWFPTIHGPVGIDLGAVAPVEFPPPVAIESVRRGRDALTEAGGSQARDPADRSLTVRYAGLSLSDPETLRYAYRLEGHDADWIDAGGERVAHYTNLPAGDYVFQVKARNADGVWSTAPAATPIEFPHRLHETSWFRGMVAMLVLLGSWAAVRLRFRRIEERNARLHREIGGRLQAEAELRRRENQLRGSQRLEAVGQLAGGIAHDFNNLLTVILGGAELILRVPADERVTAQRAEHVMEAGKRAAELTRQLLAFSRKQRLQPRVVDLNDLLRGLKRMLVRVVREDVEIKHELAADLGRVLVDPTQIEQVIVNLVVNARDAMPEGGNVVIRTSNVRVEPQDLDRFPGLSAGDYVRLDVCDAGSGIPPEVADRIFEPFFSTKPEGIGTGLGLSTVYGIVKQSGAGIWVDSEVGAGTTFKLYFPRTDLEPEVEREAPRPVVKDWGGAETILVVEDDDEVRGLVGDTLRSLGYEVLQTGVPQDALSLAQSHPGTIDLLLTDVVMPGLDGRTVARRFAESRPGTCILFMSGYAPEADSDETLLGRDDAFLPKPFTAATLARTVRQLLDGVNPPG